MKMPSFSPPRPSPLRHHVPTGCDRLLCVRSHSIRGQEVPAGRNSLLLAIHLSARLAVIQVIGS
jgi:hypothetical protein